MSQNTPRRHFRRGTARRPMAADPGFLIGSSDEVLGSPRLRYGAFRTDGPKLAALLEEAQWYLALQIFAPASRTCRAGCSATSRARTAPVEARYDRSARTPAEFWTEEREEMDQRTDHLPDDDGRRWYTLAGDESGTLDLKVKPGDEHFMVATICIPADNDLPGRLDSLRFRVAPFFGPARTAAFHACEDTPLTRDLVFGELARSPLEIDATVVDKRAVPTGMTRIQLYSLIWYEHLVHVLPGLILPDRKVRLWISRLSDSAARQGFATALREATAVSYLPFLLWFWYEAKGIPGQAYRGPGLLFGERSPDEDRSLQVADYCAWAIRRNLSMHDERYLGQIRGHLRSVRLLHVRDCRSFNGRSRYRLGVMQELSGVTSIIERFHAVGTYMIGPADDHQRVVAVEQRVHCGDLAGAVPFLDMIDEPTLARYGFAAWHEYARAVRRGAGAPPGDSCDDI